MSCGVYLLLESEIFRGRGTGLIALRYASRVIVRAWSAPDGRHGMIWRSKVTECVSITINSDVRTRLTLVMWCWRFCIADVQVAVISTSGCAIVLRWRLCHREETRSILCAQMALENIEIARGDRLVVVSSLLGCYGSNHGRTDLASIHCNYVNAAFYWLRIQFSCSPPSLPPSSSVRCEHHVK